MAGAGNQFDSLRPTRFDTERLGLILALSLSAHLAAWGTWEIGRQLGVWQRLPRLAWLQPALKMTQPPAPSSEEPLEFVTVEQPTAQPPPKAKYYSSQNSRAANPEPNRDKPVPQINGRQSDVPKTETVTKPDFNKLQPTPQPVAREQPQPQPSLTPGELTLASPKELQQTPPRPRTIAQALAQLHPNRAPGVAMRQEGGVPNVNLSTSLDVKATPFGAYDEALVEAVTQRWYDLLNSQKFALDRTGKVVLRFHLNYDGTVTDMTMPENTVGDLLGYVCQKAINDPAPFKPWPEDMRRIVGRNYREITFTFYYY
jgi:hypothetical protein